MITLKSPSYPFYRKVQFLREVNGVPVGTIKDVMIARMQGRIYSPDRDKNGFYTDTVGIPDNRLMVMGFFGLNKEGKVFMDEFYKVFETDEEFHEFFSEVQSMTDTAALSTIN